MKRATRGLVFLVFSSCLFVVSEGITTPGLLARQITTDHPTAPVTTPTPTLPPTTAAPPPTTQPPSSQPPAQQPTTAAPPTSQQQPTPSSAPVTTADGTTAPATTVVPDPSTIQTTDAAGSTSFVVITNSVNTASSTSSATPSQTSSSSGGGLGTGSIVGLSVAGGVAVLGIVGFFVWKFSRKRFSDFDDNEAIKWPELNTHGGEPDSHPLPVHNTGRAGFGNEDGETTLARGQSNTSYSHSYADSTPDFNSADPYAVPPLPHLNPNQPYRDDPNADTYYDPYRGPVPNALNEPDHGRYTPDVIPMTQMAPAGRRSPGPQMAFDGGRASPGPSMAGRTSPGPQAALGYGQGYERTKSPGPMGYTSPERRQSPGPGPAYGGRQSPGPQNAYR